MKIIRYFLVLSILFPSISFGRKFYFSTSGSDTYTSIQAQNPATPWRSLTKLQDCVTNGATVFRAGDTIAFKRGDVFANGRNDYASMYWRNNGGGYFTAPSGTSKSPIVFTNYGDTSLELPNLLHPNTSYYPYGEGKTVLQFGGVSWIVIDGLQFNDIRFPVADKANPAYTRGGIILGEWSQGAASDTTKRATFVRNAIVKNCFFSNISFGFTNVAAINSTITNCTFTNLKSAPDTAGTFDVVAGAIEGLAGFNLQITHNYIKGAWAKSGRVSSTNGLAGVALDVYNAFKNSRIAYNTFVDCSNMLEIGGNESSDTSNGAQYDTFAFNKIINCGQMGYLHGDGVFKMNNHNLYFWNNIIISTTNDRMNGNSYGDDIYGDGQSFSQFWFFRSNTKCPNNSLPISDTTWSNPENPVYCNYGGYRSVLQYATDNTAWGMGFDTLVETRNNIVYSTSGGQMVYNRNRYKRRNNIYYIKGGFMGFNTALGGTLNSGEKIFNTSIFLDTSSVFPENWDLRVNDTSYARTNGYPIEGFSTDFAGNSIVGATPFIGLYNPSIPPPVPTPTQKLYIRKRFVNKP